MFAEPQSSMQPTRREEHQINTEDRHDSNPENRSSKKAFHPPNSALIVCIRKTGQCSEHCIPTLAPHDPSEPLTLTLMPSEAPPFLPDWDPPGVLLTNNVLKDKLSRQPANKYLPRWNEQTSRMNVMGRSFI